MREEKATRPLLSGYHIFTPVNRALIELGASKTRGGKKRGDGD